MNHPVEKLTEEELRRLLMRVDTDGFPANLEHLWRVERVRYRETLRRIPPAADSSATLLDLGSSRPWLPFFQELLGYRRIVLNTSYPDSGFVDERMGVREASPVDLSVSVFDIERDRFPHADASFDLVLCLEVLEHLSVDPMGMLAEVNRVLKPGGLFILTTPNAVRYRNVVKILLGQHPQGWSPYNGVDANRHNREYTPSEVVQLLRAGGLTPDEVTTFGSKRLGGMKEILKGLTRVALLPFTHCPPRWRRDVIIAVGRKTSPVVDRRPTWLYFDAAEHARPAKQQPVMNPQREPVSEHSLCSEASRGL